jgi:hypothetical protein
MAHYGGPLAGGLPIMVAALAAREFDINPFSKSRIALWLSGSML